MLNRNFIKKSDVVVKNVNLLTSFLNEHDEVRPNHFSAEEVRMTGASLTNLCRAGVVKVIDTEPYFFCVDESKQLYKKSTRNVYAVIATAKEMTEIKSIKVRQQIDELDERILSLKDSLKRAMLERQSLEKEI